MTEDPIEQWITAYPGWQLLSVNSLNGGAPYPFTGVSATPAVVNSQYTMTNNANAVQRVYRLKK